MTSQISQTSTEGIIASELLGQLNAIEEKNKPERLYAIGDITLLRQHPKISIVGSRQVSEYGIKRTRKLTRILANQGAIIVSGLANGVDSEAHRTAIECGAKTIGVIGTPLNVVYPQENAPLQEEIKKNHLLISQFPEGHPIKRENFPIRNRTMALISDCTIIIEASNKSGTIHQGWEALRLGRSLYILESSLNDKSLTWTDEFLKYGAKVLSDNTIEDLLLELPWMSDFEILDAFPF